MEIVLENTKSKYLEIFSLLDLDNIHETFKRFSSIKEPYEAKIFAVSESISSSQLAKLKIQLNKINVCSFRITFWQMQGFLIYLYCLKNLCLMLLINLYQ